MSSCHFYYPSIIAYASLSVEGFDLEAFRKHCLDIPSEVNIYTEEVHPNSMDRPIWERIFELIQTQEIHTLIIPTLYHVVGDNVWLEVFLFNELQRQKVRLISLLEGFDSYVDGGRFHLEEPESPNCLKKSARMPINKGGTDE